MKFTNDLGSDNIKGLVWTLAVPSMLSQLVSVLYSIVDRMYIGNIPSNGTQALAGVGVCGPIVTLISSFAFLVGIGGAPLVSINLGEKNIDAAKKIIANCFVQFNGKTFVEKFTLPVIPIISRYDFFSRYLLRQILMNRKVRCFPTDKIQPSDSSQKQQKISIPAM